MTRAELEEIRERWQEAMNSSHLILSDVKLINNDMPKLFVAIHKLQVENHDLILDREKLLNRIEKLTELP